MQAGLLTELEEGIVRNICRCNHEVLRPRSLALKAEGLGFGALGLGLWRRV